MHILAFLLFLIIFAGAASIIAHSFVIDGPRIMRALMGAHPDGEYQNALSGVSLVSFDPAITRKRADDVVGVRIRPFEPLSLAA